MSPTHAPMSSLALRTAATLEGCTLLVLLAVAVPAKHFFGYPIAVAIMGPIHGLAFMYYLWQVAVSAFANGWKLSEVLRALVAALIPFGALLNLLAQDRKQTRSRP